MVLLHPCTILLNDPSQSPRSRHPVTALSWLRGDLLNIGKILPFVPRMGHREHYEKNQGVFKNDRPVLRSLEGKTAATWTGGAYEGVREHSQGAERRWPACRAYSAEVASATKAGSSGAGTVAFSTLPAAF
jgi:hypothetical protein